MFAKKSYNTAVFFVNVPILTFAAITRLLKKRSISREASFNFRKLRRRNRAKALPAYA